MDSFKKVDSREDVIVKWKDGTQNCVRVKELKPVIKGDKIYKVGTQVKMYYKKRWYFGTVLMTERDASQEMSEKILNSDTDCSSDNEPLTNLAKRKNLRLSVNDKNEGSFCNMDLEELKGSNFGLLSSKQRNDSPLSETICIADLTFLEKPMNTLSSDDENDPFRNVDLEESDDPDFVLPSTKQRNYSPVSESETICIEDLFLGCVVDVNGVKNAGNAAGFKELEGDAQQTQCCEVIGCKEDVFSACVRCMSLNCFEHFFHDDSCERHGRREIMSPSAIAAEVSDKDVPVSSIETVAKTLEKEIPESFAVEGAPKEGDRIKKKNVYDKKKLNKLMKDLGQKYTTQVKNQVICARKMGPTCNIEKCMKQNRNCHQFSEEYRNKIFSSYWNQGDLHSQREFIARHVEKLAVRRKTAGLNSRRQNTFKYFFTLDGKRLHVCRQFFINTLNITERRLRTVIGKKSDTGVVEKDRRGGRSEQRQDNDQQLRELAEKHIDRFPRVESHYCRQSSSREYLHSDLTLRKMYDMFLNELENSSIKPSFSTYRRVFRSKRLSFFHPKKDQCSLCMTYHTSKEEEKSKLKNKYEKHQTEKKMFREKRTKCKEESKKSPETLKCATFDLQQVINLPISKESAVFYKRRLSVYNFTIYDMTTRDCYCYTWHEGQSKRGSSEISTALHMFLKQCDDKGLKQIYLFADGCSGQNRNSITAATLLYVINNSNIEDIQLCFSVPNHGQSEGDSAHSAIGFAIKQAGDIFTPAQLIPIIKLARRKQPYYVTALEHSDFLNFKKLSSDLRLLSLRKDNSGQDVNWTEMTEYSVVKREPTTLFFKTSHSDNISRSITLKRNVSSFLQSEVGPLNESCPKISKEKRDDLISLTLGDTPVIRLAEHVEFYKSL